MYREEGDRVVLSPKRFYLLMSNEAVTIPPDLAYGSSSPSSGIPANATLVFDITLLAVQ